VSTSLTKRLVDIATLPGDSHELRTQKRLQIAMAATSVPMIGGSGLTFLAMGHPELTVFHVAYCVSTVVMLLLVAATRRYGILRLPHIALVIAAPFALHWQLGGYRGSGNAFLWSLLGPVAAMMFHGARGSIAWFLTVMGLLFVSLWRDAEPVLTPSQIVFQSAFNAVGFTGFLYLSTRYFVERLGRERERSERLLLNVLPAPIAERLKREERTIADRFEEVTVLFADVVGFTQLSSKMRPEELVVLLDEIFSRFDAIADDYGLEKIKTIGDGYMMVGGLPEPGADHAVRVADAALAMLSSLRELAREKGLALSMRIGLHTGDVVAGVIGKRKFTYDLWGDTVNTASRMESHGEPGRVHVSDAAQARLTEAFLLEARGSIQVKGKGAMSTHWLVARRGAEGLVSELGRSA
jgi:class 3 adenylate cyclase